MGPFTLAKKDPKIYESRDTLLGFCSYQHFFKSANFAISSIVDID